MGRQVPHLGLAVEALCKVDCEGQLLDVGLPDGLWQVVDEQAADEGRQRKDAIIIGIGLARALKPLGVDVDQGHVPPPGRPQRRWLSPDPDPLGLRAARVPHSKALVCSAGTCS